MHAILNYRGNRPINKHTHTHKPTNTPTDRTDYNTLRRSLAGGVIKTSNSKYEVCLRKILIQKKTNFYC